MGNEMGVDKFLFSYKKSHNCVIVSNEIITALGKADF